MHIYSRRHVPAANWKCVSRCAHLPSLDVRQCGLHAQNQRLCTLTSDLDWEPVRRLITCEALNDPNASPNMQHAMHMPPWLHILQAAIARHVCQNGYRRDMTQLHAMH